MIDLDRYVDPAFVYRFERGPALVRNREDALRDGLNCEALAHLVLEDMYGQLLPPEMRCFEMYQDKGRFEDVASVESMRAGDLVYFGWANPPIMPDEFVPVYDNGHLVNWRDFPITHLGVATGEAVADDPTVLHSTWIEGTNVIWPLSRFSRYRKYSHLYAVRRLQHEELVTL